MPPPVIIGHPCRLSLEPAGLGIAVPEREEQYTAAAATTATLMQIPSYLPARRGINKTGNILRALFKTQLTRRLNNSRR